MRKSTVGPERAWLTFDEQGSFVMTNATAKVPLVARAFSLRKKVGDVGMGNCILADDFFVWHMVRPSLDDPPDRSSLVLRARAPCLRRVRTTARFWKGGMMVDYKGRKSRKKTHKRYDDRENCPDLRALALCCHLRGDVEDAYLTSKPEEVTCGRCLRIMDPPLSRAKGPPSRPFSRRISDRIGDDYTGSKRA